MTDYRSPEAQAYRKLYKLAAWCAVPHGLRWRVLVRDLFTCQMCKLSTSDTSQLIADHITPHKGGYELFFRESNVQCLCKACHDGNKQQQELIGYSTQIGLDGYPIDGNHPANR